MSVISCFVSPNWQLFLSHVEMPNLGRIYACKTTHPTMIKIKTQILMPPPLFFVSLCSKSQLLPIRFVQRTAAKIKLKKNRHVTRMMRKPHCWPGQGPVRKQLMRMWITVFRFPYYRMKGRVLYLPHCSESRGIQRCSRIFYI